LVGFNAAFDPENVPAAKDFTTDELRTYYPYRGLYILRRDEKPGRGRGKWGKTDAKLVKEVNRLLSDFDLWVTYNGKMFDVPFLNTRMYEYDQPILPKALHADIYYQCRKPRMTLTSARLENVLRFFGCKHQKIALEPLLWREAIEGDKEATDEVVRHCVADVLGTTEVYNKVKGQVRNIHRG
jgi:uncharacterized protein YprB with RNaseH-like and TPR domain